MLVTLAFVLDLCSNVRLVLVQRVPAGLAHSVSPSIFIASLLIMLFSAFSRFSCADYVTRYFRGFRRCNIYAPVAC